MEYFIAGIVATIFAVFIIWRIVKKRDGGNAHTINTDKDQDSSTTK